MRIEKSHGLPDETPELAAAVPPRLLEALRAYAIERRATGQFLRAVLENDFQGAIGRADPESLSAIKGIAEYVFGALPSQCWGSREKINAWLSQGGAGNSTDAHSSDCICHNCLPGRPNPNERS